MEVFALKSANRNRRTKSGTALLNMEGITVFGVRGKDSAVRLRRASYPFAPRRQLPRHSWGCPPPVHDVFPPKVVLQSNPDMVVVAAVFLHTEMGQTSPACRLQEVKEALTILYGEETLSPAVSRVTALPRTRSPAC